MPSSFGVLIYHERIVKLAMKRKNILMIIMALLLVSALVACGQKTETPDPTAEPMADPTEAPTEVPTEAPTESPEEDDNEAMADDKVFTLDELAKYNGKDGQPAYIAVDGIVYDVSDVGAWKNGGHQGFESGKDVTDQIGEISPHGTSVLESLPKVGTLAE